jgi:hypothetical protein
MKKSLCALLLLVSSSPILAAVIAKAPNSKLIIEQNEGQLVFKIEPNKDLAISTDAPWSVKISNVQNLAPAPLSLSRKDFDATIPGFKIPLAKNEEKLSGQDKSRTAGTKTKNPGRSSFTYQMKAFICTIDKKQCFKDVFDGKAEF